MKYFVCLISGSAPDLGNFNIGDIIARDSVKMTDHVERDTLKAVVDLENDELIYWLMRRGINPPDSANKTDLQKYLITGKISRKKKKPTEEVKKDV